MAAEWNAGSAELTPDVDSARELVRLGHDVAPASDAPAPSKIGKRGKRKTAAEPRTIKASEFKAKCLALMDEVARTGDRVVITKNGKPVAELVPHESTRPQLFGLLKDELFITGDIISPVDVEWDAMK
jgi:prevent-host-death family protein